MSFWGEWSLPKIAPRGSLICVILSVLCLPLKILSFLPAPTFSFPPIRGFPHLFTSPLPFCHINGTQSPVQGSTFMIPTQSSSTFLSTSSFAQHFSETVLPLPPHPPSLHLFQRFFPPWTFQSSYIQISLLCPPVCLSSANPSGLGIIGDGTLIGSLISHWLASPSCYGAQEEI